MTSAIKRLGASSTASVSSLSIQVTASGGVRSLGDVPPPKGAHTLAVDPLTGGVWVSYSDAAASRLQKFSASNYSRRAARW